MKAYVTCDIYALNVGIHIFCYVIPCWKTPDIHWPIYDIMTVADTLEHYQPQNWLDWDVWWVLFINVLWHENASCITSPLWAKPTLTGGSSYNGPMMQSSWFFVVSRKNHLNEQSSYRWFQTAWLSFDMHLICIDQFCVIVMVADALVVNKRQGTNIHRLY